MAPELGAEALLLRATGRLSLGDRRGGRQFLEQAIELDPKADTAERARALLEGIESERVVRTPRGSAWLQGGIEVDSNVTLDSGVAFFGASSDESDTRAVWGAGLTIDALRSESATLSLGYRYDESAHDEIEEYDLQTHLIFASLQLAGPAGTALRIDALGNGVHQAGDRYLRSWVLRPNLFVPVGESLGVSRIWAELERVHYQDAPAIRSLIRDGSTYTVGLEHYFRMPRLERALVSVGYAFAVVDTDSSRDILGFRGDYDSRNSLLNAEIKLPLPRRLGLELGGSVSFERYTHRNLIDALSDDGVGTMSPSRRKDLIVEGTAALTWAFSEAIVVELRWLGTKAHSNVDVYDYRRNIVGLQLVARRPFNF